MSWRLFIYSALLMFGIKASAYLTVRALFAQTIVVFGIVFLVNLAVGETFAASLISAYLGILFVQVGYFMGLLIEALQ